MSGPVIAETLRRNFTNLIFVAFALLLLMIAFAVGRTEDPGVVWTSLLTVMVLGFGSQLLGPEFSSGTLQLILVKPINRSIYLLSRWTGVVLSLWVVTWAAALVEAISRVTGNTADLIGDTSLVALNVSVGAMLACALLALFGTFLRAYFNVGLYLVLQIVVVAMLALLDVIQRAKSGFFGWLGAVIKRNIGIRRSILWIDRNLFPEPPQGFDRTWLLLVLTNTALALLLACFVFRRREVPYGAD